MAQFVELHITTKVKIQVNLDNVLYMKTAAGLSGTVLVFPGEEEHEIYVLEPMDEIVEDDYQIEVELDDNPE